MSVNLFAYAEDEEVDRPNQDESTQEPSVGKTVESMQSISFSLA